MISNRRPWIARVEEPAEYLDPPPPAPLPKGGSAHFGLRDVHHRERQRLDCSRAEYQRLRELPALNVPCDGADSTGNRQYLRRSDLFLRSSESVCRAAC